MHAYSVGYLILNSVLYNYDTDMYTYEQLPPHYMYFKWIVENRFESYLYHTPSVCHCVHACLCVRRERPYMRAYNYRPAPPPTASSTDWDAYRDCIYGAVMV